MRRHRLEIWRLHLENTRAMHRTFFPNGKLGADLDLVYTLGAVLSGHLEGKPGRRLETLIRMRLVRREGRNYLPTEKTLGTFDHVPRLARRIRNAAEVLASGPCG